MNHVLLVLFLGVVVVYTKEDGRKELEADVDDEEEVAILDNTVDKASLAEESRETAQKGRRCYTCKYNKGCGLSLKCKRSQRRCCKARVRKCVEYPAHVLVKCLHSSKTLFMNLIKECQKNGIRGDCVSHVINTHGSNFKHKCAREYNKFQAKYYRTLKTERKDCASRCDENDTDCLKKCDAKYLKDLNKKFCYIAPGKYCYFRRITCYRIRKCGYRKCERITCPKASQD